MKRKSEEPMEYFLARTEKTESCWNWVGSIDKTLGYGTCNSRGIPDKAHRLSWRLFNGPIPMGVFVLHHCDNRRCVNPEHLWLGTQKDNQQDAVRKNRSSRGERNGRAVLTVDDVRLIRNEYVGRRGQLKEFGDKYGLTPTAIFHVVRKKNWAWLT